jgi:hypothetical protein
MKTYEEKKNEIIEHLKADSVAHAHAAMHGLLDDLGYRPKDVINYRLESLDKRPGWYKTKVVKALSVDKTDRHFIFTTVKNKHVKLRTDTWRLI